MNIQLTPDAPRTAYELLEQVCEAIEVAPQNYDQGVWSGRASNNREEFCGTAFCRAGWMVNILEGSCGKTYSVDQWVTEGWRKSNGTARPSISERAHDVLEKAGIDWNERDELFNGNAVNDVLKERGLVEYTSNDCDCDCCSGETEIDESSIPYGTKDYAQVGINGLHEFMAKHETKLKAYQLTEQDFTGDYK